MNIKKAAMMLTIMLITILSASSFYILTGEAELEQNIVVNSSTGIRIVPYHDYEFVYADEGPYTNSSGKKYYIRYTGAESGRTVVDLDDTENGHGYGLTKENGLPTINGITLTSTYKMFSKRDGGKNTEITRVFVPSSIAFPTKDANGVPIQEGTDEGIASNTFYGWNTETEKDVIYHTGQLTTNVYGSNIKSEYDRTKKISKDENAYPHVTTYVYLGSENISRNDPRLVTGLVDGYLYGYKGEVKNVFVSNSVNYPAQFCSLLNSSTTPLEYVLLDTGETWYNKSMGLGGMFYGQTTLKVTDNFKLPKQIYQGDNSGLYNSVGLAYMFGLCQSITNLPSDFEVPEGVTNISGMFYKCSNLCGVIKLPNSITKLVWNSLYFLQEAGTDSSISNYKKCNTPLIVKYPVTNTVIDNYTVNVYTPQTPTGKVTMIPITNDSDTAKSNWERVNVSDGETAPYYDENGGYYIRYKGTDETVYLDTNERTTNDNVGNTDNKDFGIEFSAGTKNPCILNTKLRSTYKMFSKRNENDTGIKRVFLPSIIAIKSDEQSTGVKLSDSTLYNIYGIASNTFEGFEGENVTEKDVIYHTGSIGATARGSNVTSAYDRTTKISKNAYSHITTYVYLGSENVSRTSNLINGMVDGYAYGYYGDVKNVFVSNSVNYPAQFFSHLNSSTKPLEYALLDNGKTWCKNMSLGGMFYGQTALKITENFKMPDEVYQGNSSLSYNDVGLAYMFGVCQSITNLPSNFEVPEGVTNVSGMFIQCNNLSGIILLPKSVTNFVWGTAAFLQDAGTDSSVSNYPTGFKTPIVVMVYANTVADQYINSTEYITKKYRDATSIQSSTNNAIVNVQEATNKIVIEDCTEEISVKVNEISNQKLTVEDETDYVSVTVNKNVEENKSEEDEVQK